MDVLGLADTSENDQSMVHAEFKEQLIRAPEGWCESGLPWRGNHPELPNNKQGSLQRLESLTRRLQRKGQFSAYNQVIQEQFEANVIEKAPQEVSKPFSTWRICSHDAKRKQEFGNVIG